MLIESERIIERVRYMMECMELNATAFATEAGITPSVISHMLNGRNRPTIETLNNIIAAYPAWNYEWLLFGKGLPKQEEEKSVSEPLESSLFDTNATSSAPLHSSHSAISAQIMTPSQERSFPFTTEEITQLRQMLQQKQIEAREVSEIRIFYSDGSYEIFTPHTRK